MSTSRDDPDELARQGGVREGHAWVNYDKGLSKGRGNGGTFYQAEGPRKWSHDVVYDQNPELEAAVGTADQPMPSIFDCTQGTVGKGRHGEGTNQRKLRQLSNGGDAQATEALELIVALRKKKKTVCRRDPPCPGGQGRDWAPNPSGMPSVRFTRSSPWL